jgi:hypothetical protein
LRQKIDIDLCQAKCGEFSNRRVWTSRTPFSPTMRSQARFTPHADTDIVRIRIRSMEDFGADFFFASILTFGVARPLFRLREGDLNFGFDGWNFSMGQGIMRTHMVWQAVSVRFTR